ncbi:alpha/beta fold hydrolase [Nocardia donostiensis]|uniref:Alpha/beta hydrolase n=1 Tax=Nocardia donostiensis TaxID=1538463 RepID=A0A1W0BBK6_9NOCA|nr:alpha/beta hydrolase [Nocardia donostiensis]ONM49443.1 alpha/beta hydrolase [Nocardia donostiensis]OQS13578.1 alpha/beta hydrolase [Nocardia donostiensis]OQS19920.1 alpha/beta hydrolase [Nocardia donostiensis]
MTMLNQHREGSGEPLVLIHGVGSRWQVWQPVIEQLTDSFEMIAIDLPGFGASAPLDRTTVTTLTDAVADFLAEQGIERPHIGGNSMGGLITLNLAARGLARTATAFSPIGFWDTPGRVWCQRSLSISRRLARMLRPTLPAILGTAAGRTAFLSLVFGKPWTLDTQTALDTAYGAIDALGFDPALASFTDTTLPDPTALADLPVTIAWGNHDILLTYATQSRRAEQVLPNARHTALRGSGHTPFYDDPDGCALLLRDQLHANR